MNDSPLSVTLSVKAAEYIQDIIAAQELSEPHLILYVAGGGCSGLKYGLSLADGEPEIDDIVIYDKEIKICVDPSSAKYLNGATIDYIIEGANIGFKIENPNASKTCGCSNSFSVDGEEYDTCGGCGYK